MSAYGPLASFYDQLTEDVDYRGLYAYLMWHFNSGGVTLRRVLDMACGTGSLSMQFAARGVETLGMDLSEEMLVRAREKAENAKVEKEVLNSVNRRLNCDEANLDKTVNTALSQLSAIRRLRETDKLDSLSPKLREAARLREEHPELNLSQLGALAEPPVTKSTLNYRLKKIMEIAGE